MTATTSTSATETTSTAGPGLLPGLGGLLRKEFAEWRRARRTWVVLLVSALFMMLTALNMWLQANVLPADGSEGVPDPVVDPLMNLVVAVSGQIFAVAAIFAVMGLIVSERETGTLAWTASKPVSRAAIWLSKFSSSTVVMWVVAGLLPFLATVTLVVFLYGPVPISPLIIMSVGICMSIVLYVAVALTVSTVVTSQAAVAGIALAVMFLPQLAGLVVSPEVLPTAILDWALKLAGGELGALTLMSWAITVGALIAFSMWRMERLEF